VAKKKRGIYADPATTAAAQLEDKVADFSYQNDSLAELIVECWGGDLDDLTNGPYQQRAIAAKQALAARGIYLAHPIVITEDEYESGFHLATAGIPTDTGIVFVVPRITRVTAGKPLLESAKMLMAITPNGI
jgi:hypothetical protein